MTPPMWEIITIAPVALLHGGAMREAERFLPPLVPVVAPVTHLKIDAKERGRLTVSRSVGHDVVGFDGVVLPQITNVV